MSSAARAAFETAVAHFRHGRIPETLEACRQALAADPASGDATHLMALAAANQGDVGTAESCFRRALELSPRDGACFYNFGRLLAGQGRWQEATTAFRRALECVPEAAWYLDLARALRAQGLSQEEFAAYQQALRLDATLAEAWNNMGGLLLQQGNADAAIEHFKKAVSLQVNYVEATTNWGLACITKGDFGQAIDCYRRAIELEPRHAKAHYFLGLALEQSHQNAAAMRAYQLAAHLNPDDASAFNNLGNVLKAEGDSDNAISSYRQSLRLRPDGAETWSNLATILMLLARHREAMDCARKAVALAPTNPVIHGNLLNQMIFDPDQTPESIAAEHARHDALYADIARLTHANDRSPDRRLRIGIVSPDFRDHITGRTILPLFRERDRSHADFICYSMVSRPDAMTEQFRQLSDGWVDLRPLSDDAAAERIRADGIDILADLTLHMSGNRLRVFARKPAPVQVTLTGYPGTTGLRAMDYRLTDPHLDPPGQHEDWYVEKTVRLPDSFWCYDPLGMIVPVNDSPSERAGVVTFGCLNNFCKLNESVLQMWAQVLGRVPGSRLRILAKEGSHRRMVTDIFELAGINADRVEFLVPRPRQEYLRSYHEIDISLDTVPYNGHTTSLDSLWMGVPVVTLVGETVVGRAGLSQLSNLGMPELIAHTRAQFVDVAAALADDRERMVQYRRTLRTRMEQSALLDTRAWTRGVEAALRAMWRATCAANET